MLKQFFKSKPSKPEKSAQPQGAPGKRCYAIGDIHGCADELKILLGKIRDDHAAREEKPTAIVSLGDLIDRGPDSRGVIEQFMTLDMPNTSVHVIAGNHEEMLLTGITENPSVLPDWLRYGGYAFCESYGITASDLMGVDDETIRTMIRRAVPEDHIRFLENTLERVRFGDYLLVHAGIDPERPIEEQESRDLRWIRDAFLNSDKDFGVVVVHGHTVADDVELRPNRIGLDTGAYRSGKLACVRLEGTECEILTSL